MSLNPYAAPEAPLERPEAEDGSAPGAFEGLWRRALAWFLDSLLLVLVVGIAAVLTMVVTGARVNYGGISEAEAERIAYRMGERDLWVGLLLGGWLYRGLAAWRRGTFGMRALGLRVARRDGGTPGAAQGLLRSALGALHYATFGLGFLLVLGTRGRRSLADLASGTQVLRR